MPQAPTYPSESLSVRPRPLLTEAGSQKRGDLFAVRRIQTPPAIIAGRRVFFVQPFQQIGRGGGRLLPPSRILAAQSSPNNLGYGDALSLQIGHHRGLLFGQ